MHLHVLGVPQSWSLQGIFSIRLVVHQPLHCHQAGRAQRSPESEPGMVEVRKAGKAAAAFPGLWLDERAS